MPHVSLRTISHACLIVELPEGVDTDTVPDVARELTRRPYSSDAPLVVIDGRTPPMTVTALTLPLCRRTYLRAAVLCVGARSPQVRPVLRSTGRTLRVSATRTGTQAAARGCPNPHLAGTAREQKRPRSALARGRLRPY